MVTANRMGKKVLIASSLAAMGGMMALSGSAYGAFVDNAVGVYDAGPSIAADLTNTPPTPLIITDASAGAGYTGTGTANYVNLATFTSNVASAYAAGFSGDENFMDQNPPSATQMPSDGINMNYASGTKTMPIVFTTAFTNGTGVGLQIATQSGGSSSEPSSSQASGTVGYCLYTLQANQGVANSSSGLNHWTATFGPILNGASGEAVLQAGITILGRNSGQWAQQLVTLSFTFSDSSTETLTSTVTKTKGADVFFGIQAPAGLSITSMTYTPTNDTGTTGTTGADDLAVITGPVSVPEPASLGILGLAGGATLVRRRRK